MGNDRQGVVLGNTCLPDLSPRDQLQPGVDVEQSLAATGVGPFEPGEKQVAAGAFERA